MEHEDLKRDDPRRSTRIDEDEVDAQLLTLFRSVEAPAPSADFAARAMRAVTREPLPAGRTALRSPLASLFGWAALIAAVALSALAVVLTQPLFASMFSRVVSRSIGLGVWLMQFRGAALRAAGCVHDDRSRGVESCRDERRNDRALY